MLLRSVPRDKQPSRPTSPTLPGGDKRRTARARQRRTIRFQACDDPAAPRWHVAAVGAKIRAAGAAQHHCLSPRRHRRRRGLGRGRRYWRQSRGGRGLLSLGRRRCIANSADRALTRTRNARRVLLKAGQRRGTARRDARAKGLVIGTAGLAKRVQLRLGRFLRNRRAGQSEQNDKKECRRADPDWRPITRAKHFLTSSHPYGAVANTQFFWNGVIGWPRTGIKGFFGGGVEVAPGQPCGANSIGTDQ